MQVQVLESNKNSMKIEIKGESHTLGQLLAKQLWQAGAEAAAVKEHHVLGEIRLVVQSANPQKALEKAAAYTANICEDFKNELERALEK